MELAADSTEALEVYSELQSENAKPHMIQAGGGGASQNCGDEMEDRYSIRSLSPSAAEDPQQADDRPGESAQQTKAAPHLGDGPSNTTHHLSPLESIKELEEADEQTGRVLGLHRSPGDGALKMKEAAYEEWSRLEPADRGSEADHVLGAVGASPGNSSEQPVVSVVTCDERAKLDSALADLLNYPQGISDDEKWEGEESRALSVSLVPQELGRQSSTGNFEPDPEVSTTGSLRKELDSPVPSLKPLLDPNHQADINDLCRKLKDSSERIGELEVELNSMGKRGGSHAKTGQEPGTEVSNSSLIKVLTECKSRVEQLEELKHSSFDIRVQLQAAQGTAAFLQRRVLCLEEEHSLRQQEVVELTGELEEARKALQQRSTEMAGVTAQLQVLQQEMERKWENRAYSAEVLANGQAATQTQRPPRQDSKVCTLL